MFCVTLVGNIKMYAPGRIFSQNLIQQHGSNPQDLTAESFKVCPHSAANFREVLINFFPCCIYIYTYVNAVLLLLYRWYRELHMKESDENWRPGPARLTTSLRITPKLLKLKWEGYPLYHHDKHGWGYIVPGITTT